MTLERSTAKLLATVEKVDERTARVPEIADTAARIEVYMSEHARLHGELSNLVARVQDEIGKFDARIREEHDAHTGFQGDIRAIRGDIKWIKAIGGAAFALLLALVTGVFGPAILRVFGLAA